MPVSACAVDRVAAGLGGERQHAGGVARAAAVVGAVELLRLARLRREAGAAEHRVGARLVADERERDAELGLGERGREGVGAGVGVVAEVADRGAALAGEHHERVGEILAALLEVAIGVDEVREVAERRLEGAVGHVVALRAGAGEEVGDVGVEPAVAAASALQRPKPPAPVWLARTSRIAASMRCSTSAAPAMPRPPAVAAK